MRTYADSSARRKIAAQTVDDIFNADKVVRHYIDFSWLLDALNTLSWSLLRGLARLAYSSLNAATFIVALAASLIYSPLLVDAEPLHLVEQTEMWSVDDSPVYIEGESAGANDGFEKILRAYNYRIVKQKHDARFVVTVNVALDRPKTCLGEHEGVVTLRIQDTFTSKKSQIRGDIFTERVSCKKGEYVSELNAALRVAVHRQHKVLYAPFKPDEEGML